MTLFFQEDGRRPQIGKAQFQDTASLFRFAGGTFPRPNQNSDLCTTIGKRALSLGAETYREDHVEQNWYLETALSRLGARPLDFRT